MYKLSLSCLIVKVETQMGPNIQFITLCSAEMLSVLCGSISNAAVDSLMCAEWDVQYTHCLNHKYA